MNTIKWRGFRALCWTELKLLAREPMAVFFTLLFPAGMLVLFGSIYGNRPSPMFGGRGTLDVTVPAFTGLVIGTAGFMGLVNLIAAYRERGVFRRLGVAPVHPLAVVGALGVATLALTLAGMVVLVAIGMVGYGLALPQNPAAFAIAFVVSSLAILALGFAVGSALPTVRTAGAVSMAVFFPMIYLSGATFPRELLPEGVRRVAEVLPLTQVVTVLRATWAGDAVPLRAVVVLLAILVVATVVGSRMFRWT